LFEYIANRPPYGIPLSYMETLSELMPVPIGLAHTDIEQAFPDINPSEFIRTIENRNIFIELNEAYARPGESRPFYTDAKVYFEAAKRKNVFFSTGSDLHLSLSELGSESALRFLEDLNLESQLLPLIFRDFPANSVMHKDGH